MGYEHTMILRSNMAVNEGRIRSCTPKTRYPDYHIASKVSRERNMRKDGHQIAPYYCIYCKQWHVGAYKENHQLTKYPMKLTPQQQNEIKKKLWINGGAIK